MSAPAAKPPVPTSQLQSIARDACTSVLSLSAAYDHTKAPEWNSAIVNKMLQAMSGTASPTAEAKPQYKYAVNSTIIQHLGTTTAPATTSSGTGMETPDATPEPAGEAEDDSADVLLDNGRRGMHSATGAYWNNETDGMWSFKWEGGEEHGMDVVLMVIWVSV